MLSSMCRRRIPIISLHNIIHTCSYSSSSAIDNSYLRKKRKSPSSRSNSKKEETWVTEILTKQELINSTAGSPKSNLLSILTDTCSAYQLEPSPNDYYHILRKATQNPSRWDQIPQILDHVNKVETFETREYFFTYLINFYGKLKQPHLGYVWFFSMPAFGCNPSVESLNSLLLVLLKNKVELKIVLLVMVKCQSLNIWAEESTFVILIEELCKIGKGENAFDLLNLMVDSGYNLDETLCSLILSTICEKNEGEFVQCENILGVFEEMRSLGFCPKRVDLCNVIRFCVKNGKGVDALEVLNKLKMSGMVLDIVCYNLVLNKLILDGEYENADEVFDELLVLGLVPNIVTYNVYINGLCMQNKFDEAIRMVGCMEDLGCKPEMNSIVTMFKAYDTRS